MKLRLKESPDFGLLVLRVGIGLMFVLVHGLPEVMGGVSMWTGLGGAFNRLLGVAFIPAFWGFLATLSAFGGAMCLMAGVLFRPACSLMFTLVIAVASIIRGGYGLNSASQPVELGFVLLSLIFTGPGRLTLPSLLLRKVPEGQVLKSTIWFTGCWTTCRGPGHTRRRARDGRATQILVHS